jgi:cyclic beta-1,2-glucan synthetase
MHKTRYEISVSNPERRCSGVASAELDGEVVDAATIPFIDDGGVHHVRIRLGPVA